MNIKFKGKKPEILLVEDSPSDINLVKEGFKDSAIEPNLHVVTDGASAIDFLLKQGEFADNEIVPDLIILDLNLPKKNGLEVLSMIKSRDDLKRIPVSIFTSSADENDIIRTYDSHANCYMVKPINLDEFIETIRLIEEFWIQSAYLPTAS